MFKENINKDDHNVLKDKDSVKLKHSKSYIIVLIFDIEIGKLGIRIWK